MFVRLKIYKIPTRTLPLKLNSLPAGHIKKTSTPINIIRSPHIDKRSWEQFTFSISKNLITISTQKQVGRAHKIARLLTKYFSFLRITLITGISYRFKSLF